MDIKKSFMDASKKFNSDIASLKLYKEQSIYCDIISDKKTLAIVYNFNYQRVLIYNRDKSKVDKNIIESLSLYKESLKKNNEVLYIDLININEKERVDYYLNVLTTLERYFFTKTSTQIKPIKGDYIDNRNNKIIAPNHLANCNVQFLGENCTITIANGANIRNLKIDFYGDGSSVSIGEKCSFSGHMRVGHNSHIIIGTHVTSTSSIFMRCVEGTKIQIGNDCMFATGNQIRTDDAHPIYSVKDGKRLNYSKDIIIGNHVWIAYNAVIFGGSNIGDGSIIGFNSLVNKKFPNNCTIAGTPARIIKKDVFWQRSSTLTFDSLNGLEVKNFHDLSYCNDTVK